MRHGRRLGAFLAGTALLLAGTTLTQAWADEAPPTDGGEGVDVPPGTVGYHQAAAITSIGRPLDVLWHPDSEKLYVASDNSPTTADVDERGLYALDPADGTVRSWISQAPGSTGALRQVAVSRIAAPLPGDGVVFGYPVRGLGTAADGDEAARGVWLAGATVTDVGPGTTAETVLVAQGSTLSEVETATGAVRRTATVEGTSRLASDPARGTVWSAGSTGSIGGNVLRRVDAGTDAASFGVTASTQLPDGTLGFLEVDPATGELWVGIGASIVVYDAGLMPLATIEGDAGDRAAAAAFDGETGRAFVLWQDSGHADSGGDDVGAFTVFDSATREEAACPVALPGNRAGSGAGAVAVEPGGATVFVTSPAAGEVVRLDRSVSPRVVQAPEDVSVAPGAEVVLMARAEGRPEPTVRWQSSADGGANWQDVEGATSTVHTFTATTAHDGLHYRAEFTNAGGTTRTPSATVTVTPEDDTPTGGASGASGAGGAGGAGDVGGDGGTGGDGRDDSAGTDGGTATAGGPSSTTGTSGTAGGTTTGGGTGGSGGGSLAATGGGLAVLPVLTLSALLLGAGWFAYRRGRASG